MADYDKNPCPCGTDWSRFSVKQPYTYGFPGYICRNGILFSTAASTRDVEKERIAKKHYDKYILESAKDRSKAGKSIAQQAALKEILKPLKKKAIDATWQELHALQRKRKDKYTGPSTDEVERVLGLYTRYDLEFNYGQKEEEEAKEEEWRQQNSKNGPQQNTPTGDNSTAFAAPSTGPTESLLRERAAADARIQAVKEGQAGGKNQGGKQTDDSTAAVKRILDLKSSQFYEILDLTGDLTLVIKADIMVAYYDQSKLTDPILNGHKDAKKAFYMVKNAMERLLPKHQ